MCDFHSRKVKRTRNTLLVSKEIIMDCSNPSSDTILNINSLGKIPLIAIMEHASIPWAIKDLESRIIYMNNAAVECLNLPVGFDFEGRKDEELPHPCSGFAEKIQAQDRKAEASREGTEAIITSISAARDIWPPFTRQNSPCMIMRETL